MGAQESSLSSADALTAFSNPQAWYGPDLASRDDWMHEFSPAEIAEIDAAVARVESTRLEILDIRRADFPLPKLGAALDTARTETLHGRGFHLLRGVPVERYTQRQSAIAFWGLGLHLGEPISQNGKGHVLGHVTNLGLNYDDPEVRGYQTNARLPYHADLSDVVALLCLRASRSGGLSSIVSSTTIWNELVSRHPEHARSLLEPLYYTRWGEIPAGKLPYEAVPVFAPYRGRMIANYVRSAIRKAQELPGLPRLSDAQNQAMDCLDALAADPRLHLDMEFRPGDVQIVCNYSIFHSRTAYEDWPEQSRRRHLLRLWLACADGPPLPQFMNERSGQTASGRPNGIWVPGVAPVAPLEAV